MISLSLCTCLFLVLVTGRGPAANRLFCRRMGFYRLEGLHLPLITSKPSFPRESVDEALQRVKVTLQSYTDATSRHVMRGSQRVSLYLS